MDAIKFIKGEHKKIRAAFKRISKSYNKKSFDKLCKFLVVHETMEEKKWYPKLKSNAPLKPPIKLVIAEEKAAAKVIKSFKKVKTDTVWVKKFLAFKKAVEKHAHDEETKLFPKVRKLVSKEDLLKIGKTLQAFKKARWKGGKI